jgi:hypothetical protein
MKFRHKILGVLSVVALAYSLLPAPAQAQFAEQGPKLVGTGAVGFAHQGYSVSLSGDGNTAIVGGPSDNPPPFFPLDRALHGCSRAQAGCGASNRKYALSAFPSGSRLA